jgi:hypothetical protein
MATKEELLISNQLLGINLSSNPALGYIKIWLGRTFSVTTVSLLTCRYLQEYFPLHCSARP